MVGASPLLPRALPPEPVPIDVPTPPGADAELPAVANPPLPVPVLVPTPPSAAPDPTGKSGSNHGWGLAIDLAVEGKGGQIVALASAKKALKFMCETAPKYGFFLQGSDPKSPEFEAWHWQYCLGDATPPALQG